MNAAVLLSLLFGGIALACFGVWWFGARQRRKAEQERWDEYAQTSQRALQSIYGGGGGYIGTPVRRYYAPQPRRDDPDYVTPAVLGYMLGSSSGSHSARASDDSTSFRGGGGSFDGGGSSGSWDSGSSSSPSSDSSSSSSSDFSNVDSGSSSTSSTD
jgi:uncharacterized membrane protein YgcG